MPNNNAEEIWRITRQGAQRLWGRFKSKRRGNNQIKEEKNKIKKQKSTGRKSLFSKVFKKHGGNV